MPHAMTFLACYPSGLHGLSEKLDRAAAGTAFTRTTGA